MRDALAPTPEESVEVEIGRGYRVMVGRDEAPVGAYRWVSFVGVVESVRVRLPRALGSSMSTVSEIYLVVSRPDGSRTEVDVKHIHDVEAPAGPGLRARLRSFFARLFRKDTIMKTIVAALLALAACGSPCPEHTYELDGSCEVDPCWLQNDAGEVVYDPGAYGFPWGCPVDGGAVVEER